MKNGGSQSGGLGLQFSPSRDEGRSLGKSKKTYAIPKRSPSTAPHNHIPYILHTRGPCCTLVFDGVSSSLAHLHLSYPVHCIPYPPLWSRLPRRFAAAAEGKPILSFSFVACNSPCLVQRLPSCTVDHASTWSPRWRLISDHVFLTSLVVACLQRCEGFAV